MTGPVLWRISEVPLTTFDSCLWLQNGLWQAIRAVFMSSQHKSIIDPEFWQIVQDKLAANRRRNCCFFPLPEPSGDVRPRRFRDSEGTQKVQKVLLFCVLKIVVFVDDGICFGCNSAVIRPTELW